MGLFRCFFLPVFHNSLQAALALISVLPDQRCLDKTHSSRPNKTELHKYHSRRMCYRGELLQKKARITRNPLVHNYKHNLGACQACPSHNENETHKYILKIKNSRFFAWGSDLIIFFLKLFKLLSDSSYLLQSQLGPSTHFAPEQSSWHAHGHVQS